MSRENEPSTRTLGRTELRVPRIVLGAMARRAATDAERIALFERAVDLGLTTFDTAPLYDFGGAERQLGVLLGRAGRTDIQILTKAGLRWDGEHGDVLFTFTDASGVRRAVRRDSRPAALRKDVEESLQRLAVDTLDLVQLHHPDRHTPIAESMGALLDLRAQGKLRHIGVSNFDARQLREAARALGDVPLCSVQPEYNLLRRGVERDLLPACRELAVGVLAYSPLAEGLLAGRPSPPDSRIPRRVRDALQGVLRPLAEARGVPMATVALAWLTARPGVTAAVAGASTTDQLDGLVAALSLELEPEECRALEEAFGTNGLPDGWQRDPGLRRRLSSRGRAAVGSVLRSAGIDPSALRRKLRGR
jgi:aryl-alcohol dehydrogenase-like predicted oxidoreductase